MILKKLWETLFLTKATSVAESRRNRYLNALWLIIGLHVLGLILVIFLVYQWYEFNTLKEFLKHVSEFLHYIAFTSALFLFILSLKSEVLVSQTYEFASSTAQASSHQFETFKSQLEWINEFISPTKFESHTTNLIITISTPMYGIGVGVEDASLFLDFFQSWVEKFEKIKTIPNERPTIEFAVWDKMENVNTFTKHYSEEENKKKLQLIDRFAALLTRFAALRKKGFINFHLFFTDRSDARLFMAHTPGSQKYAGLFAMFTPLYNSAVTKSGWTLTGFSFWEEKVYHNILQFNFNMTNRDNTNERIDRFDCLRNPKEWLLDHYGLKNESKIDY